MIPALISPPHYLHDAAMVAAVRACVPGARAVYRYGTAGGEFERQDSDVDIGVLAEGGIGFDELLRLSAALSTVTGRDVEVVDMQSIPVTLRVNIVAGGVRIFARGTADAEEFDSRAFSDYARLNEERMAILEDVRARGTVYG